MLYFCYKLARVILTIYLCRYLNKCVWHECAHLCAKSAKSRETHGRQVESIRKDVSLFDARPIYLSRNLLATSRPYLLLSCFPRKRTLWANKDPWFKFPLNCQLPVVVSFQNSQTSTCKDVLSSFWGRFVPTNCRGKKTKIHPSRRIFSKV